MQQISARQTEKKAGTSNAIPAVIGNRSRFLAALRGEAVDRPPMWLMRQAGRCLPEYRELRQIYSFRELIRDPLLATEVTLQPIRRFNFDGAILFSDILVVPEALGQSFEFRDGGGVQMNYTVKNSTDIENLEVNAVPERLAYVGDTLRKIKGELGEKAALLGFVGSPWTLANFMLEGGSCPKPVKALNLFRRHRDVYYALGAKLTEAVIQFLRVQIDAGVDAVQIFDSLGGLLPARDYEAASGWWIRMIVESLGGRVPVIVFGKGVRDWAALSGMKANVIGIDHEISMEEAIRQLPEGVGIQGNLNPELLAHADAGLVAQATSTLLEQMRHRRGYIFNLGHGVPPDARLENLQALTETVRNFK